MSWLMDWMPEWLGLIIAMAVSFFALTVVENSVKKIRERKRQPNIETKEESQQKKSNSEKPSLMSGSVVVQVRSAKDERDRYKAEANEKAKELATLRNQFKDFKRQHGLWRVHECGLDGTPIGLSVAVQFIEPRDSDLAEKILGFFCTAREIFKTNAIEQVKWFKNPSDKAQVVIFSDHAHANGIKAAFRACDLLEEKVDRFQMSVAGIEQVLFDIAIVVFPSDRSASLTPIAISQAEYDALPSTDKKTLYVITSGEND